MFIIRNATQADIEFLTMADLLTGAEEDGEEGPAELGDESAHRKHLAKIAEFVANEHKGAWVGHTDVYQLSTDLSRAFARAERC